MDNLIHNITYLQLIDEFYGFYAHEFGHIKFRQVADKVKNSTKVHKLLANSRRDHIRLGTDDYLLTLHSSSSFTFAKAETIFLASVIMLSVWEDETGRPNNLSDDVYMNTMFFRLLTKCDKYKTHVSNSPNFFSRLTQHLNNVFV